MTIWKDQTFVLWYRNRLGRTNLLVVYQYIYTSCDGKHSKLKIVGPLSPTIHSGLEWPQFLNSLSVLCLFWANFLISYSTVQYSIVQYSTVQYSTVQYSTVQYITVQYSTVQYSTVRYSTVRYSTVQYSTVLYSTLQYSTVYIGRIIIFRSRLLLFSSPRFDNIDIISCLITLRFDCRKFYFKRSGHTIMRS